MDERNDLLSAEERRLLKNFPLMLTVYRVEKTGFRPVLINDIMCAFLGDSEEYIKGGYDEQRKEYTHPEDYQMLIDADIAAYLDPDDDYLISFRTRAGSSRKYVRLRGYGRRRISSDGDDLLYVIYHEVGMSEEAYGSADEQSRSEKLLSTILSTTQTAIFWKDKERRFLGANRAFLDYYDFNSEDEIIGRTDEDMGWHNDPEPFKNDEVRVLREGISTTRVHGHCVSHGEDRDIVASKSPIFYHGKIIGLVGSFEDVTDEYRQRNEINDLNRSLVDALKSEEMANRSISELLSRTSHEIRTPMNAIIGLSELGLEETEDRQAQDTLIKIRSAGQYLLGIINDILDMNKMEGGQMHLTKRPANLLDVLDNINNIILPLAKEKNIEFAMDYSDVSEFFAVCDQMRVQQIIINLLNNAVKFTDPGGRVDLVIMQKLMDDHMRITIMVKDTGCGISGKFIPKLFKSFSQENRDPSKYGTGTGLGLSISRNLARLMEGDITVESTEGVGSVFTVEINLGLCSRYNNGVVGSAGEMPEDSFLSGAVVLLAEDNAINREVAMGILKRQGIMPDVAADGAEAVEKFAASEIGHYDVVLLDIQMPVMDGYEAAAGIRGMDREDAGTVPIIALTADVFASSIRKALDAGMDDLVAKPIDMNNLYATMKKYMLMRQSRGNK